MKIRFIFSPEQKEFWDNNPEQCNKLFSPKLAKKIRASLEASNDSKHAVIDVTEEEYHYFIQNGKPINIKTINILTVPTI